jgi:hypothetical protein
MKIPKINTALEARQLITAGYEWLEKHGREFDERLGDPRMRVELEELRARIKEDPEIGAKLMRKAGIWNKNNKLTKKYRGGADGG